MRLSELSETERLREIQARQVAGSAWERTARDCPHCLGGYLRRNRVTSAEWCPNCHHETNGRTAGPAPSLVPVPCTPQNPCQQAMQLGAPDPSGGQPSGCARCETLGFEIVVYDDGRTTEPRRVGLVHDPRIAESCARALNLGRIAWQKFPAYSSRAVRS